jgi:flagellar motor switch protein FliM
VNNKKKFEARPGLSGKKRAIQVIDFFKESYEENSNDG